jgi:ketosteroid isomerase-like protein
MHAAVAILLFSLWAQGTPATAEQTAVMTEVHLFVDAFNTGDTKTAASTCADETSIIDEFPPHEWHGAGACTKWMSDFDADAKKNGVTDAAVTLSSPRHVDVTADSAYVVVPADYTFKQNGTPVSEKGSTLTVALRKTAAGWRIAGWSWTRQ